MQSSPAGTSPAVVGCSLVHRAAFEGVAHTRGHRASLALHGNRGRLVKQIPLFYVRLFWTLVPTCQSLLLPLPHPNPSNSSAHKIQSSFAIFLIQALVFFPWELSASPHHVPCFSHHIQPVPALWNLSHFPSFPLQEYSNALRLLLALSGVTQPRPQGTVLWFQRTLCCFFWPLPHLLPLHHPALSLLLTKRVPNHFGQRLDSTGSHPASPIFREKPHALHFHHPCNMLRSDVPIFALQHLLQKQLKVTSCPTYTNHPNAESQCITGINSCSRKQ